MPLHLYRSNRIEHLAEILAELLRRSPPADPFAPVRVAVGSRGMEQWLRQRLAERLGICAHIEFPFPASLVTETLDQLLEGATTPSPEAAWGPDPLAWAILELLPTLAEQPALAPLRPYLNTGPAAHAREYALARQVADIFDRYATFRPELALAWSGSAEASPPPAHLSWQPLLWKAVQEHLGEAPHRATRLRDARDALADLSAQEPLRLFGLSSLPPAWIDLLAALPVDVELFLLCPSVVYWADLRRRAAQPKPWRELLRDEVPAELLDAPEPEGAPGHPLLASMGRVGRDLQLILECQPPEAVHDARDFFGDPGEAASPSALHWLQSDLLHARHPSAIQPPRALPVGDRSVQLHACYGPTRQVEALRDTLLHLLEDHPDLEPRDVLVMTPDVATFAPLVHAVFSEGWRERDFDGSWGPSGAPRIPVLIDDQRLRGQNPFADALSRVLALTEERVTASAVLELLHLAPVRRRLGLTAEDLPLLESWAREAGARWGLDAEDRQAKGQPRDPQNTWAFALERLALGVCLPEDDGALFADRVLPFDAIEGRQAALVGPLVELVRVITALLRELSAPRSLSDWPAALHPILDRLTLPDDDDAWANLQARKAIDALAAHAALAKSERLMDLSAVRTALDTVFDRPSPGSREGNGAVTVCAMAPMRSVPYRVIALLGLDDGAFPRQRPSAAFDLTAASPRVGDRDPRDEDRYLLLEAILAARDHLLIYYTGHDLHSNEPVPPAVPVGELCEVLDQSFVPEGDGLCTSAALTTIHPLQPWAAANFLPRRSPLGEELPPWSFSERLASGAMALRSPSPAPPLFAAPRPSAPPTSVGLDELGRFLVNPTRGLLRRLSIAIASTEAPPADREPVELEALDRWQLVDALLADRLAGRSPQATLATAQAAGKLPLGAAGLLLGQQLHDQVDALIGLLDMPDERLVQPDPPVHVHLERGGLTLSGQLHRTYGDHLLYVHPSGESAARLLPAWIELLAWAASAPHGPRRRAILALSSKNPTLIGLEAPDHAEELLWDLVEVFLAGQSVPLRLFPRASYKFASASRGSEGDLLELPTGDTLREALATTDQAWSGGYMGCDLDDPYIARVWGDQLPHRCGSDGVDPDFGRTALRTFGPLLQARHTGKTVKTWLGAFE